MVDIDLAILYQKVFYELCPSLYLIVLRARGHKRLVQTTKTAVDSVETLREDQ